MSKGPTRMSAIDVALGELGSCAQPDVAIGPMTTYRVGGRAAIFARPRSFAELSVVAAVCRCHALAPLVIGRGSNLLIADRGFPGIAISLAEMATEVDIVDTRVTAGSAVALPQLARRVAAAGLAGFEWAVGVPGTIGGAVRMNAGGHGSDIASCLLSADIFDLDDGSRREIPASGLGLRFRGSDLVDTQVVLAATIQLAHGDADRSERMINEIVRWRRENQPGGQNAGSVFVNPIPGVLSAGELIDRIGLRGLTHGTASVSMKHANFIQGAPDGSADDVCKLIELVRHRVHAETGYLLRSEVRLIGFDDAEKADVEMVIGDE